MVVNFSNITRYLLIIGYMYADVSSLNYHARLYRTTLRLEKL